jgi:hypothetical protein
MGWASILHVMEGSGAIADYLYVETIVEMDYSRVESDPS